MCFSWIDVDSCLCYFPGDKISGQVRFLWVCELVWVGKLLLYNLLHLLKLDFNEIF